MIDIVKKLEKRPSRRAILKAAGTLFGIATVYHILKSSNAHACIGAQAENAFYEVVVKPVVSNPELLRTDPDGRIYARMSIPRNTLRDVVNNPDKYVPESDTPKQERLYGTLDEALRARSNIPNTHIVEFDSRGVLARIYDYAGSQLPLSKMTPRGMGNCRPIYSF